MTTTHLSAGLLFLVAWLKYFCAFMLALFVGMTSAYCYNNRDSQDIQLYVLLDILAGIFVVSLACDSYVLKAQAEVETVNSAHRVIMQEMARAQ